MRYFLLLVVCLTPAYASALDSVVEKQIILSMEKYNSELTAIKEGKATYDSEKKELTVNINESPKKDCWRLVYNQNTVYAFFSAPANAVTRTIWNMICGTYEDCYKEAKRLKLDIDEFLEQQDNETQSGSFGEVR